MFGPRFIRVASRQECHFKEPTFAVLQSTLQRLHKRSKEVLLNGNWDNGRNIKMSKLKASGRATVLAP
jgi:hypothetical protein